MAKRKALTRFTLFIFPFRNIFMKAALYVRVSTEEQAKEGFSIPAQLGRLEAYCKSKGWRIYDEYIDDGYTGREKERPAYAEMMRDIEYWDVLLTLKIDRVHRNLRNFLEMFDILQRNNKHFATVYENIDTSSAIGRFFVKLIASIAELESEQISERVKLAMDHAKKQGYHVGRPPKLFTRKRVNGHLVVEPSPEALRILDMHRKGMSYNQISYETGIPLTTVYRTVNKLKSMGY